MRKIMSPKIKILIGVLVVGVILIAGLWVWKGQLGIEKQVTITTDKTEYTPNEKIKITVKNNLNKSIWYHNWNAFYVADSFSLEQKVDEKYKVVDIPGFNPGAHKVRSEIVELKPHSKRVYWFDLVRDLKGRYPQPFFISPGTYRLRFSYHFSSENLTGFIEDEEPEGEVIYSNEFTIKEYMYCKE